jgi:hypothetical protein
MKGILHERIQDILNEFTYWYIFMDFQMEMYIRNSLKTLVKVDFEFIPTTELYGH